MADRKAFTDTVVRWVKEIIPGSPYIKALQQQLESLSDADFEAYVQYLESSGDAIPLVVPNLSDVKIDVARNLEVGKKLGHDFFQYLYLTDAVTGMQYKTPLRYMVIQLPFRRQQQLLEEKINIPEHNRAVDDLTGQPTGASKGASMTFPEVQVLRAQGVERVLEEVLKYRGGDIRGFQAMNRSIMETGGVSLDDLGKVESRVRSTETLHVYMLSAHLDNNL